MPATPSSALSAPNTGNSTSKKRLRKYGVKGPYFHGQGRERYCAHLEPGLRDLLQEKADARGTSLNNLINIYLREKLSDQNPV